MFRGSAETISGLGVIKADMSLHLNSAKDEITWMSTMDHSK